MLWGVCVFDRQVVLLVFFKIFIDEQFNPQGRASVPMAQSEGLVKILYIFSIPCHLLYHLSLSTETIQPAIRNTHYLITYGSHCFGSRTVLFARASHPTLSGR